jgi:AcrR family transcriptional regulator
MRASARKSSAPAVQSRTRKPRGLGHERPQEILAAAKQMFLTGGYESFTTRALAQKVGLSQTGLYIYFKTKDEILDALCQQTYEATLQAYASIDARHPHDLDRLRAMIWHTVESGAATPEEYQIIYMTPRKLLHGIEELKKPLEQQSRGARIFHWQRELLKRLIQSGSFRRMDPTVAAQVALAAPHGLVAKFIAWPDFPWADRKVLTDTLIDTLIAGFTTRAG